jgi:F-type H+-transporting ATPase subunit a
VPPARGARRFIILAAVVVFILFVIGLPMGAIGSSFVDKEGFLPKPEVHLPPQPIFPNDVRIEHLNLAPSDQHELDDEGHGFEPLGFFEFAVTNTMLSAWFTTIILILLFGVGASKAKLIPGRLQNLVEMIFEAMLRFVESVVGRNMAHRVFPMITTIFLFVLFNAWLALLPIYFSLGFKDASGDIKAHLLRSAGTDINMPLALALISFVFVEYMGLRVKGFHYLGKFFSLGNLFKFRIINLFVGFLELVSELVRIVSFTFRLFGNMMAGEILLVMVAFLVPFVAIDMVYGLELLVGLIQALIFAGLTLVFVSVAVAKNDH